MQKSFFLTLLLACVFCTRAPAQSALAIAQPRVEYHENPQAVDVAEPRFSWRLTGEGRNRYQTAYRLVVLEGEKEIWNTGKVVSPATNHIVYAGPALRSGTEYRWTVTSWDENDLPSPARGGQFATGLLNFSDWQGKFIGHDVGYDRTDKYRDLYLPPARYLRKAFTTEKAVKRATAYTTALGLYELRLNGEKVGDASFLPGWTDYEKRLYYQTFDVTDRIRNGENVIGATIADGWYAGYVGYALLVRLDKVREFYGVNPAFMGQLHLEYTDGTTEIIASGPDWQAGEGPVREADIIMGEAYDARLENTGWDTPGYRGGDWRNAKVYTYPNGKLQAYPGTYVKDRERLTTKEISEPTPGVYVFDLGRNIAGVAELKISAPAGTRIQLKYGEILRDDGTVMTENLRRARATDTYIAKGGEEETWRPRFTYHGFQYVEVTGLSEAPPREAITGIAMSSIETDASTFASGNEMNNQLYENIKTTQAANFFEVPTDCPQRDERLGWTGDAQIYARSATYNSDVAAFFTKWLVDLDDSQHWYGAYPNFAPFPYSRPDQYSPAWMDAGIIVPYTQFLVYGDTRAVEKAWAGMERFMDFQADASTDHLRPGGGNNYGDWLTTGKKTSDDFIASAYYAYDAMLMAEMAEGIGNAERAAHYQDLHGQIKDAFGKRYLNPDGTTTEDTQTALALALYFGLYPENMAPRGAQLLATSITENGDKFSTGFLGTKHVMLVLSEYGYHDLAYRVFQQTDYPSWGFSVVNGSTSIWERWNSYTKDANSNDAINAAMNSFSHYAFGSVAEWMYKYALGIDTRGAGYREIVIKPAISREMDFLEGSYESINGTIASSWRIENDGVTYRLAVPVNVTARVILPLADPGQLREEGKRVAGARGEDGGTSLEVGSGSYEFTFPFLVSR